MAGLTIAKNDYGYNLSFTVQDASGTAYNLADFTAVTLKIWVEGSRPDALLGDSALDIDNAASGTCHYTVQSGDFSAKGSYVGELELTASGVVESTDIFTIKVAESG